jgi:protein-disulfide isomerase
MHINKEAIVISVIGILFVGLMGFLLVKSSGAPVPTKTIAKDSEYLVRAMSHMTGTKGAKVELVEFGDYECPACGVAHPNIKQITDAYKTNPNFSFVFRNYPLPQHPNAPLGAEAAEAAGAQGKYWEMHDMLYENQAEWGESKAPLQYIIKYAQKIGLDMTKFTKDINGNAYAAVIKADQADGDSLQVDHTPTLYVNGQELATYDVATIKAAVDAALAK